MFRTEDPRKTILFYIKDQQQLATVAVDLEKGLQMTKVDNPVDFVNNVLKGDKGVCLNTDLSVTYVTVTERKYKSQHQTVNDYVITVAHGSAVYHYLFN